MKTKKRPVLKIPCIIILFLLFLPFLSTCVSTPENTLITFQADEAFIKANRLVVFESGLSLPAGWSFRMPSMDDGNGILFRFYNADKTISGSLEYINFGFQISKEKIMEYYTKEILKGYRNPEISAIRTSVSLVNIISARHPETSAETIIAFIFDELNVVNVIELVSQKGMLLLDRTIAYRIFSGFTLEIPQKNIRTIKEGLKFYCYDESSWRWLDDCERGFYLMRLIDDRNWVVGIRETDIPTAEEFLKAGSDFDLPWFDAFFPVNNNIIIAKGSGYKNKDGFLKLYYFFKYKHKNYRVYISMDTDVSMQSDEVHQHKAIAELFTNYLLFD